ncbi:Iron-sulfur cluster-binding protein [hydrothermal vent metagenome]|uniref:Iron-sulfur cluster-binding protein n=1 Tax=hydrothermal vent metagenome TaxID=652676 RepID=A0A3B0TTF2_9ZZZZ
MQPDDREILVCNCKQTMALDSTQLGKALGGKAPVIHNHLCRSGIKAYEQALAGGEKLLVACTQEAPLFSEIANETGGQADVRFVNIRENAGWCDARAAPHAKIAALLAAAKYTSKPARLRSISSDGLCLVYGRGAQALETARLLADRLSVTLLLTDADDLVLPTALDLPIVKGRITTALGGLGGFEVTVDGYASLLPSSRGQLEFAMPRDGARSDCSLILDLSGGTPLFTGHKRRDGYIHADPGDPAAVLRAAFALSDMVGEFEKPIYVHYDAEICAHGRSRITGCSKCLDTCPAGAITEAGDGVNIDPVICGGCGICAAVCPTGAVAAAYPPRADTIARLQIYLGTYGKAGGDRPIPLIHDGGFGADLIAAMARFGRGLPAHVLPFDVHAPTSFGHVEMLAAFAAGAERLVILTNPKHLDELAGIHAERELAEALLAGFGYGATARITILSENDPDIAQAALYAFEPLDPVPASPWQVTGNKREVARTLFAKLAEAGRSAETVIALPQGAPYGRLEIDAGACTLCMACVSACPASALFDNPDLPQLQFVESACVQCGLCVRTCPETAITLTPRLNLAPAALGLEVLYKEEPFSCIECGKLFATKSTIEHISAKLAGKHWMFQDDEQSKLIKMCDDCRVIAQANSGNDPFSAGARKKTLTTEDYLDARAKGRDIDDFLIDD